MQVSIACTDHNLKGRNGDDRHSKQNATSPNVVNAARAKFRTVAIIARSFGAFTPKNHISLKESTAKLTGMKYSKYSMPVSKTGCDFHPNPPSKEYNPSSKMSENPLPTSIRYL
ncbi:UNVERIFIED_CONTAM: hypothetical protein FKN15_046068 [Acipenser sinensis]